MLSTTGIIKLFASSLAAVVLCLCYMKYRDYNDRKEHLKKDQLVIEQVRKEVRKLETRVEQAHARVDALKKDSVEAEAIAREIGGAVGSKAETVFHVDERLLTPPAAPAAPSEAPKAAPAPEAAPPISAPAPKAVPAPKAAPAPEAAPPISVPAPQQVLPPAKH